MNIAESGRLVSWIKAGNAAESYEPSLVGREPGTSASKGGPKAPPIPGSYSWRYFFTPDKVLKLSWSLLTAIFLFLALKYSQKSSIQVHVKDLPQEPQFQFNPGKDWRE